MEIQKIEICNLNSLKGEFPIDLMGGQLKGQDIFAITGTTGSGKSTILDAITLALYNRIPRLDNKKGEGNKNSKDPYERLKPSDTENTLTRGEKRGYAKVVFEAGGQRYRAEWLCELKERNFGGSHLLYRLENHTGVEKADLLVSGNLTNEFLADGKAKDKTVSKMVVDLIGLGYDQFCKACILAQNSFANFLKADDFEKADILEKITGTSIYGRIADVIVKGYNDAAEEKKEIDDKVSGQKELMLKDDELTQKQNERDELLKEKEGLDAEIQSLEKGLGWWKELGVLEGKTADAEALLAEARKKEQDLLPGQKKLERHDKVAEGLKLRDGETDAQRELTNAENNVKDARKRLEDNKESIKKKGEEKALSEKELDGRKAALAMLAWAKPIKENISLIRSEYRRLDDAVRNLRNAASLYSPEGGYGRLDEKGLIEAADKLTRDLPLESTREAAEESLRKTDRELALCEDAQTLFPKMEQVLAFDEEDKKDNDVIVSQTPLQEELEKDIQNLDGQIKTLENKDFVFKRGLLVEGKPCELCGATHHPFATAAVFNEAIELVRSQLTDKKGDKEKVDGTINAARDRITIRKGQRNPLNADINDLKSKISAADDSFSTVFAKYLPNEQIAMLKGKAAAKPTLEKKKEETENTLSLIGLRALLQDARSHKGTLGKYLPEGWYDKRLADRDGFAKTLEEAVEKYNDADTEFRTTEKKVNGLTTAIETLKALIPGLEKDIEDKEDVRVGMEKLLEDATAALNAWMEGFNAAEDTPVSREELDVQVKDNTDWTALREAINDAENNRIEHATLFEQAEKNLREHREKEDRPAEEKDALEERSEKALQALKKGPDSVEGRLRIVDGLLFAHEQAKKEIAKFKEDLEKAGKKVELWKRFYNMLGKSKGDKEAKEFRKLAQNYTLGLLLRYSNEELGKFTKRYTLKKQNDSSLEIMVLDGELGERYASSLSGGETFMVSLALALGLSSISSGSVTLKNIFIDEGFGSLDGDLQKTVISALNTLRMQGKRIGLISHTAALLGDDGICKIAVRKVSEKFSVIDLG